MKKNCDNCKHLKYFEADYESFDSSGFYCEGRDYHKLTMSDGAEKRHLKQLESDKYREHSKKCSELRPEGEGIKIL